jgi:hypothetical protein
VLPLSTEKLDLSTRNKSNIYILVLLHYSHPRREDTEEITMAEKVAKVGIKKEKGYLYFVDKKGDISRAKMARGGRKKKAAKRKTTRKKAAKRKPARKRRR